MKFRLLIVAATLVAFTCAPLHAMNSTRSIVIGGEVTWRTYDKVQATIDNAPVNGILYVYIDSPGGDADAGHEIADKLLKCKANVVTVVDGMVASVAFDILIAGDYTYIDHNDLILLHAAYTVVAGVVLHTFPGLHKLHENQKARYKGYLTTEEEKFIFEDWGDLIMSSEVFLERVDNDITHLKQLQENIDGHFGTINNPTRPTFAR